jgi:hypothetical protein
LLNRSNYAFIVKLELQKFIAPWGTLKPDPSDQRREEPILTIHRGAWGYSLLVEALIDGKKELKPQTP